MEIHQLVSCDGGTVFEVCTEEHRDGTDGFDYVQYQSLDVRSSQRFGLPLGLFLDGLAMVEIDQLLLIF